MSVTKRFETFLNNICLTDDQLAAGKARRESVVQTLNKNYYSSTDSTANSKYIGSWGKHTRVRPPRDVDVLYELPKTVYDRFEARSGNKQSQLLQEVKSVIEKSYPSTNIKGDGPVVLVGFTSYNVEIVPAFKLTSGQYWIPMTDTGGRYKTADYDAEITSMSTSSTGSNGNTRDLTRMMKTWQAYCSVPIKSFHIEIVAIEFINQWEHRGKTKTYYDWMVRDFLNHLVGKANNYIFAPGTYELMNLGEAWLSRARTAYSRAARACALEGTDAGGAGDEWQKIFGYDIPRVP